MKTCLQVAAVSVTHKIPIGGTLQVDPVWEAHKITKCGQGNSWCHKSSTRVSGT